MTSRRAAKTPVISDRSFLDDARWAPRLWSGNRRASPLPERRGWGHDDGGKCGRRLQARWGAKDAWRAHPAEGWRGRSSGTIGAGRRSARMATGACRDDGSSVVGPVCVRVVDLGVERGVWQTRHAPVASPDRAMTCGRYRCRQAPGARHRPLGREDGVTEAGGVALATQGLAKRYGSRVALDGLDLRVPTGVVYGFLGPNGAGKTTTMRILTGLIRPDAGGVEVLGRPVARGDRRRLFEVGALIESPSFYPFLSGRENLRALAATGAPTPKGRVDELLGAGQPAGPRLGQGVRLLAGHEAAAGDRERAAVRPQAAAARRAGERPRPRGHRRDARHAPCARRGRQDGLRLEPHPVRGPAAGGRRRDHRPGQAGPRGADRGPPAGRGGGADPRRGRPGRHGGTDPGAGRGPGHGDGRTRARRRAGWASASTRSGRRSSTGRSRRPGSTRPGSRAGRRSNRCSSSSPGRRPTWAAEHPARPAPGGRHEAPAVQPGQAPPAAGELGHAPARCSACSR